MKKIIISVSVLLIAGLVSVGAVIENRTHALKVAHLTGAPLLQVLDLKNRFQEVSDNDGAVEADEEARICQHAPCEMNQD